METEPGNQSLKRKRDDFHAEERELYVDVDNFSRVPMAMTAITCIVCFRIPQAAVRCPNDHVWCGECHTAMCKKAESTTIQCPMCKHSGDIQPARIVRTIVDMLHRQCKHDGCSEIMAHSSMVAHEQQCVYKRIACPNQPMGCDFEGITTDVEKHTQICVMSVCSLCDILHLTSMDCIRAMGTVHAKEIHAKNRELETIKLDTARLHETLRAHTATLKSIIQQRRSVSMPHTWRGRLNWNGHYIEVTAICARNLANEHIICDFRDWTDTIYVGSTLISYTVIHAHSRFAAYAKIVPVSGFETLYSRLLAYITSQKHALTVTGGHRATTGTLCLSAADECLWGIVNRTTNV